MPTFLLSLLKNKKFQNVAIGIGAVIMITSLYENHLKIKKLHQDLSIDQFKLDQLRKSK